MAMIFPGLRSLWTIFWICMKVNPRIQSLKTGKNYSKPIGLNYPFFNISNRSSSAFSIKMFNIKGFSSFAAYSRYISSRGINGTEGGNNKWNCVSMKTLEIFSNVFS